jgi:hypothetical protein
VKRTIDRTGFARSRMRATMQRILWRAVDTEPVGVKWKSL